MTLEEIRNSLYEAEGLMELARLRPEKLPELMPLVKNKIDAVKAAVDAFEVEEAPAAEAEVEEAEVEVEETPAPLYDIPEEEEPEEEPEVEEEEVEEESEVEEERPLRRPVPAFCLNDRFRFRRAIFGGSDADFKAAMEHIATLDDFTQAEDLFYGDLELDPEDPDVIDFMQIIKNSFEA